MELPSECHVCALTLISSPHLARSYHHLFPVPAFNELAPHQVAELVVAKTGCKAAAAGFEPGTSGLQDPHLPHTSQPELPAALYCHACLQDLTPKQGRGCVSRGAGAAPTMVLQCPECDHLYCYECDAYIHESLHNCPGCECLGQQKGGGRGRAGGVEGMDIDGLG